MDIESQKARRTVWCLTLLLLSTLILSSSSASGQPVAVQLLNGKTRKPLKGYKVYILLGDPRTQHMLDLKTDHYGMVHFDTDGDNTFQVRPVGTTSCSKPASTSDVNFSVSDVMAHGVVTPNDCGNFDPEPMMGQVTFLTRSASGINLFRN